MTCRIIIADDHPMFREGMLRTVQRLLPEACVEQAGDLDTVLHMLKGGSEVDTLILDCLRPARHPTHFSLAESLAVARRVNARRTLLIHMSHDIEHAATSATLPAGVELAYDGLVVPLV